MIHDSFAIPGSEVDMVQYQNCPDLYIRTILKLFEYVD